MMEMQQRGQEQGGAAAVFGDFGEESAGEGRGEEEASDDDMSLEDLTEDEDSEMEELGFMATEEMGKLKYRQDGNVLIIKMGVNI